ncbi:type II toxin-antitoxin system RelE/ParE family toxin [Cohnella terricola]|uniref:Type II toxin-antitoxin system RelE/ParE family toxin n=1 Tax=Cohnella terricola TaxID=1289167 RepID=A0A559J8Y6_9BACL|nr:type II toxin-antitoxin system RelE/ParE family toxin [Cohnella terricola]
MYSIEIDKDALKYLQKLERPLRIRITNALQVLLENPFNSELDIKRLKGTESEFRLRVGSHRVIYSVENQKLMIYVIKISSRGDVYKH